MGCCKTVRGFCCITSFFLSASSCCLLWLVLLLPLPDKFGFLFAFLCLTTLASSPSPSACQPHLKEETYFGLCFLFQVGLSICMLLVRMQWQDSRHSLCSPQLLRRLAALQPPKRWPSIRIMGSCALGHACQTKVLPGKIRNSKFDFSKFKLESNMHLRFVRRSQCQMQTCLKKCSIAKSI